MYVHKNFYGLNYALNYWVQLFYTLLTISVDFIFLAKYPHIYEYLWRTFYIVAKQLNLIKIKTYNLINHSLNNMFIKNGHNISSFTKFILMMTRHIFQNNSSLKYQIRNFWNMICQSWKRRNWIDVFWTPLNQTAKMFISFILFFYSKWNKISNYL